MLVFTLEIVLFAIAFVVIFTTKSLAEKICAYFLLGVTLFLTVSSILKIPTETSVKKEIAKYNFVKTTLNLYSKQEGTISMGVYDSLKDLVSETNGKIKRNYDGLGGFNIGVFCSEDIANLKPLTMDSEVFIFDK